MTNAAPSVNVEQPPSRPRPGRGVRGLAATRNRRSQRALRSLGSLGAGMHWIAAPVATRWRVFAFAVLTLVLGCVDVWLIGEERDAQRRIDAQAEALEAARTRVPVLLSYSARTLRADLVEANQQTTGEFHDDYQKILSDVVVPSARRNRISTEAAVQDAAVVHGGTNETVVLVFLTQTTLSRSQPTPAVTGSRVEVTMTYFDGEWLVSGLKPV